MAFIKPLSDIQSAAASNSWFFNEGQLNAIGNRLYSTYKNTAPTALGATASFDNGNLTTSKSGDIYYGAYKSYGSRGYEETYFAFFYKKSGSTSPSLTLTFKNGFIDDVGANQSLTLTLTIDPSSDDGSATSLIPFFSFEASATMQSGDTALGWMYTYVPSVTNAWDGTGVTANVASSSYKLKQKVKFTSGSNTNPIPLIVSDMNNEQAGESQSAIAGYRKEFSESCYIPSSFTNIYTGCDSFTYNGTTYSSVSTVEATERSSTYSYIPSGYIHYHGTPASNGYNQGSYTPWPSGYVARGVNQELACGVGFMAPLGTEFYVAGSKGVCQLFPPFSPEFVTIQFNKGSNETFTGLDFTNNIATTEVHLSAQYSRGGWPGIGTRTGYTFVGWFTASSGGTEIKASTIVPSTYTAGTTINLYSRFTPTTYTITYDSNGGSSVAAKTYNIEQSVTLASAPTKTGYNFAGWKLSSAVGNWAANTYNASQSMGTGKYGNITLVAQWTARTYTINYSANGGTGTVSSQTKTFGTNLTLRANSFTRTGYSKNTDKTWNTNSGGTGTIYAPSSTLSTELIANPAADGSSSITLYAQWTINQYVLTTAVNSATMGSASGGGTYTYNTAHNVTATANPGYEFVNWTLSGGTTGTYTDNPHSVTMPAGAVTATATFKATTYTATFAPGSGTWSDNTTGNKTVSYSITTTLAAPATISRTGYTFAGWKVTSAGGNWVSGTNYNNSPQTKITGATGQYGAVTFTAQWNINSYQLTTSVNDSMMGSASGAGTYNYNSSHAVTATPNPGYEFVRWELTGSLTDSYTDNPHTIVMPAGSVNAKAVFKARTYTVTFNPNTSGTWPDGDDGDVPSVPEAERTKTVTYNSAYGNIFPNTSTWNTSYDGWKWDYSFSGWFTDPSSGTEVQPENIYDVVGNQTLYAHWSRVLQKYDITWIEADIFENVELEKDIDVLAGTHPSFDEDDPSHYGYEFLGWSPVGVDQQGYPKPEGDLPVVMNDLVYKAVYDLIPGSIKFEIPEGVTPGSFDDIPFNIESLPITVDGREGAPYAVTKPGNEFIGWMAYRKEGEEYIPLLGSAVQVYKLTSWVDYDIILKPKFVPALSPFEPKPGYPGNNDDDPDNDNDNYGIPIDDLDDSQQYKLKFEVEGDRESDPIFDISVGTITKRNNKWVWNYESDVLTKSQMKDLMEEDLFILDVWRCIVWRTTGILKVTLETYENGTLLGEGTTVNNPFELYGWMTPYINDEPVDDSSDVVPVEGVDSIENLDLWANGVDTRFTKRFIGNGKSTVDVIMTAHNTDDGKVPAAGDVVHGEVLYGAVPTIYYVSLNSDDTNGGATYNGNVPNPQTDADKRALQQQWESLLTTSDEPNNSYRQELRITTNPFPNIVHRESKDEIDAVLRLRVYDSRHLNYKDI